MAVITTGILQTALLLVLPLCSTSFSEVLSGVQGSDSAPECEHVFKLDHEKSLNLHVHNFTKNGDHNHYCTVLLTTSKNMRIVLNIVYQPAPLTGSYPKINCSTDYVHVGNDMGRVNVILMTSYRFCGEHIQEELISKDSHMWIVFKASRRPKHFAVKVRALEPVMCLTDEFPCSPVQCVQLSVVCNGVKDCENGHDEFCHRDDMIHNPAAMSEPCFRCQDGTCIQPRLSRYDISYRRVLWYLCDGYSHCRDAWDERQEICGSLSDGRVGQVTECVPSDLQFGPNGSVLMWNEIRCDGNPDCFYGDDERDCYGRDSSKHRLRVDPATLGAVVGILVTACLVICVTYRLKVAMKHAARPSTSSTVDTKCTQCTATDTDRCDSAAPGAARSDSTAGNITTNEASPEDESVYHDDDGISLSSQHLRHTIV